MEFSKVWWISQKKNKGELFSMWSVRELVDFGSGSEDCQESLFE